MSDDEVTDSPESDRLRYDEREVIDDRLHQLDDDDAKESFDDVFDKLREVVCDGNE